MTTSTGWIMKQTRLMNNVFWTPWKLPRTTKRKLGGWMKIRRELWRSCKSGQETRIKCQVKSASIGRIPCCCTMQQLRLEETRNLKYTHITSYFNRSWIYYSNGLQIHLWFFSIFFVIFLWFFESIFSIPLLTHNPWKPIHFGLHREVWVKRGSPVVTIIWAG